MTAIASIESRVRSFQKDHRGAIMVLGIFFACMMIGWMWMLVGLGDAMIWRDRSQEAADAVTYSSSAVQAKAMNLISFLNLILLVITFIYLIMAFLWNFLDIAHSILGSTDDGGCGTSSADTRKNDCTAVATILEFIPYLDILGSMLQPICDSWDEAADAIQLIQGRYSGHDSALAAVMGPYERMMASVMPPISTVEDWAGYGAPWAGEVIGIYAGTKYTDWNVSRKGAALGATLFPGTLGFGATKKWETKTEESPCGEGEGGNSGCSSGDGAKCTAQDSSSCQEDQNSKDYREGLPVEITEEGMSDLCYIGAKAVSSVISGLLGNIPVISTIVGWLLDSASSSIRDNYCEQDSTGYFESKAPLGGLHTVLNMKFPFPGIRPATYLQNGGCSNSEDCPNGNWGVDGGGGSDGCAGGPDDCEGVYQIQKSDGTKFWHNRDQIGGPHLVVEYAENGNDWFQTWSFVYGGDRPEQAEKLVGLAGMDSTAGGGVFSATVPSNSGDTGLGSLLTNTYIAQSEFYFDCDDSWESDKCNSDWTRTSFEMSWRARLRRVKGLSWKQDLFKYITGGSLGGEFNDWASKFFEVGTGSKSQTTGLLGQFGAFAANSISSGAFGDLKNQLFNYVGGAINPASTIPDIIH